jgi:ATP-dependent Lon protease
LPEHGIPEILPILPIEDAVVFPYDVVPLLVSDKWAVKLVDQVLSGDKMIGTFAMKGPKLDNRDPKNFFNVGTACVIHKMLRIPDGSIRILVQGLRRAKIKKIVQREPFIKAKVDIIEEKVEKDVETEALIRNVIGLFQKVIELAPYLPDDFKLLVMNLDTPGQLADFCASNLNLNLQERQALLDAEDPKERLTKLMPLLTKEVNILEVGAKIRSDVSTEVSKVQREHFLREQLKAIQKELGERDAKSVEIEELQKKIEAAKLPKEAHEVASKELDRLSSIPTAAPEYNVVRTYLDWLTSVPWTVETEDNLNIERARNILEEDHYDLKDVKERILEYLAVRKLKKDTKGPILCFVGPPGVGKTSLGKSIARALGRKFIRFSLGGVRDEAEIRGHRRTYVGALPGRIIQSIKRVGFKNPVFMLDEVDKIGVDFRGDPAAALLEVLDPEQNNSFMDHYLDVPFDLSKVMFITTANIVDPIPPALKDRMETLKLPGYIVEEKMEIAKRYLIPRQINENGLTDKFIEFSDNAIKRIIQDYTREAGVRELERNIATCCRKVAKEVANGKRGMIKIIEKNLNEFLGPPKFFSEVAERKGEIGVATGVAWTPVGGDIIFVEATKMKGKRGLILTGQLGDVMQESAKAALSYVRSDAKKFGIDGGFFDKYDIHVHVPEGAIPKDGPSAGVTMATALVSLIAEKPVNPETAMTGEITLRGKVLPVGGIKEKVLAAKRAGIKKVILPEWNRKDLQEIPDNILKGLEFVFAKRVDEVINRALENKSPKISK